MTKHYLNSKYQSEQRSSAMKKITMGTASIILGSLVYIGADSQQVNAATEATNATNNQSTQVLKQHHNQLISKCKKMALQRSHTWMTICNTLVK